MHPDVKHVTWILSIWIFLLLWRAVCVQGEDQSHTLRVGNTKRNSDKEIEAVGKPLKRMKRLEVLDEPVQTEPQLSSKNVHAVGSIAESGDSEDRAAVNDKVFQKILKQIHEAADQQGVQVVEHKTTPQPLDTGQKDDDLQRTTPQPLDTIQDARNTSKVRKSKQNKTQIFELNLDATDIVKVALTKHEDDEHNVVIEKGSQIGEVVSQEEPDVDVKVNVTTGSEKLTNGIASSKQIPKKSEAVNVNNVFGETAMTPPQKSSSQRAASNGTLKFVGKEKNKQEQTPKSNVGSVGAASRVEPSNAIKLIPYEEFVQNAAGMKNNQTIDKAYNQTNGDRYLDRLNMQKVMKQTRQQSLILLQNATKEADDLQQRLKNHKLKLISYIEVLKEASILDNGKKAMSRKNYTNRVREKVDDIVNPKRVENHNGPKEEYIKTHFFAKDIPETLRARVDMQALKKSESFWDKKGADIEEPHLIHPAMTEEALQEENKEIVEENKLDLNKLALDYVEDDSLLGKSPVAQPQSTTRAPSRTDHDFASDHLNDYHQTKLNEISITKDRLKARTPHEMFIMSQMISGRIHGNVLAPPPERCSVKANMKRYRPPEDEMDEDESLLYRAKLQTENEMAIEGAPMDYLTDYKNPCWLSKITDDKGTLWYDYTETGLTYKRMSFLYEMRLSKGSNWRMRCLPYFYFIGVTKSGTTDMYSRLMGHPEIMRPGHKEPMWWNRLTLGMAESLRKPFRYYVDFFDEAAELIRRKVVMKDGKPYHPAITVDATPANLWDYDCWTDIPGNRGLAEPRYTLAHSIKKLVPNARIVMMLREPTSRLYSQYRMKSHMESSATFHKLVMEAIVNFNKCLETRTLRSCAYDYEISKHEFQSPGGVFMRASLYYVFVKDWLDVFSSDQVKVIRTEDYHNNTEDTLVDVFDFLGLSALPKERLHAITRQRSVNRRSDHIDRSMAPMLPETQRLLDDFFRPYNKMLAKLLHSKKWKWNDV